MSSRVSPATDQGVPVSALLYAGHTSNNPINRIDPTGHIDFSCLMNGCPDDLPIVTIVLGGTDGKPGGTRRDGPDPIGNLPAWVNEDSVTVQYEFHEGGENNGKFNQARQAYEAYSSLDKYRWIDYDILIVGYSAGGDSALFLGDEAFNIEPISNGAGSTKIIALGPTFSGDHPLIGGDDNLTDPNIWAGYLDHFSEVGIDFLIVDDSAAGGDNAYGYTVTGPGRYETIRRNWEHTTEVRTDRTIREEIEKWFE